MGRSYGLGFASILLAVTVGQAAGIHETTTDAVWSWESNVAKAYVAEALNPAGDVNGDDYDDFILGSFYWATDNQDFQRGRAWLFYGSDTGPSTTPDVTFSSPTSDAYGWFGQEAIGVGDVNTDGYDDVLIAMPNYENSGFADEGGVFVYYGSDSGISQSPNWSARGNATWAHLGFGAGPAGDVNGDGYDDIIAGANSPTQNGCVTEVAYVWYGSATGLDTGSRPLGLPANADWSATDDQSCSGFGRHTGTAGDVNGDGYDDIFIAAPLYDRGQTNEGMAFVWYGSDSGLGTSGTPSNADWSAEGNQVEAGLANNSNTPGISSAGDVNGDGYDDLAISAFEFDGTASRQGMVALWLGSAAGLTAGDPDWVLVGENEGDVVGYNLSSAGDFNGDGYDDLILAAHSYDRPDRPGESGHGRVMIWFGSPGGMLEYSLYDYADCLIDGEMADNPIGITVSGVGDVDGDDLDDVAVGAWYYDNPEEDEGIVYGFRGLPIAFADNFESGDSLRWSFTIP